MPRHIFRPNYFLKMPAQYSAHARPPEKCCCNEKGLNSSAIFTFPTAPPVLGRNGMCATPIPCGRKPLSTFLERRLAKRRWTRDAGCRVVGICEPQRRGSAATLCALFRPRAAKSPFALNRVPGGARRCAGRQPICVTPVKAKRYNPRSAPASTVLGGRSDAFCTCSKKCRHHGLDAAPLPSDPAILPTRACPGAPSRPAFGLGERQRDTLQGLRRGFLLFPVARPPRPADMFRAPGQAELLRPRRQKTVGDAFLFRG